MGWPNAEKNWWATAEKMVGHCRNIWFGQSLRRPSGFYFLHWPNHIFSAMAHPYFFCSGPPMFFLHWPNPYIFCTWPILLFSTGHQSIYPPTPWGRQACEMYVCSSVIMFPKGPNFHPPPHPPHPLDGWMDGKIRTSDKM